MDIKQITELALSLGAEFTGEVHENSKLLDDLNIDSLVMIEFLVQIEKRYNVSLNGQMDSLITVQNVIDAVNKQQLEVQVS